MRDWQIGLRPMVRREASYRNSEYGCHGSGGFASHFLRSVSLPVSPAYAKGRKAHLGENNSDREISRAKSPFRRDGPPPEINLARNGRARRADAMAATRRIRLASEYTIYIVPDFQNPAARSPGVETDRRRWRLGGGGGVMAPAPRRGASSPPRSGTPRNRPRIDV